MEDTEEYTTDHEEVEQDETQDDEHYPTLDEIAQENGFMSWGSSYNF